jgi:mRNA interferase RelE/StbE
MIVEFEDTFTDCLKKIKDASVRHRIEQIIKKLENVNSLQEVSNIKAIKGWEKYYRIRFGDFRIGFFLESESTIILLAVAHRSKIYKHFP